MKKKINKKSVNKIQPVQKNLCAKVTLRAILFTRANLTTTHSGHKYTFKHVNKKKIA